MTVTLTKADAEQLLKELQQKGEQARQQYNSLKELMSNDDGDPFGMPEENQHETVQAPKAIAKACDAAVKVLQKYLA